MTRFLGALLLAAAVQSPARAQQIVDDFERPDLWSAVPGEGVELTLGEARGRTGAALQFDFDFHGRGGYAVAHRDLDLDLPENYELAFWIRGTAPSNTLEFKLIDSTGANVWWSVRREFVPSEEWTRIVIPRRHVTFAWGPLGGGHIRKVAAIEIAVTAGTGGKGTVFLDDLTVEPREPVREYTSVPRIVKSDSGVMVDFGQVRVFGGVILEWTAAPPALAFETSSDGRTWHLLAGPMPLRFPKHYLRLPEAETRWLRLRFISPGARGTELQSLEVQPAEWATSRTPMLQAVARDAPPGTYPRFLLDQQSYWTIVGSPADTSEALVSEDGAIEVTPGGPSLEPFLFRGGRLLTWHGATISRSLADGDLPIPTVRLDWDDASLEVTAAAPAQGAIGPVAVRYRIHDRRATRAEPLALVVALRPWQVNPPWQFLNQPGGPADVGRIELDQHWIRVNGTPLVRIITPAARMAATGFSGGDIIRWLSAHELSAEDLDSLASGMVMWAPRIDSRGSADVYLLLPLGGGERSALVEPTSEDPEPAVVAMVDRAADAWRRRLAMPRIAGPPAVDSIARAIRSSLGYILVNRDGAAIQPGSRSYSRSWIRDGALTSTALLRLGHFREVRDFIDWFVPYQYPSGRAPCCVDRSGAGPVPEHDSTGELIYLIAEYVRLTGDTAAARSHWAAVERGARFLDSLRHERLTDVYRAPDSLIFYGLLPPSISHEGYSAKPVHSYWDDFFALLGFKDAAWLASTIGREADAERWSRVAAEFRRDFLASIALVRRRSGLGWIPGSADLADFDATSTSIAFDPAGEGGSLPRDALLATFERYHDEAMRRQDTTGGWDAYTPYEWRNVGALVRLGEREKALEIFRLLMADRRPLAWNQWGEVVWRERRIGRFIGDMPHTWVASDFIRSALDLFAYERSADSSLVLLAGVPADWLAGDGIVMEGLRTARGGLSVRAARSGNALRVNVTLDGTVPPGGIVLEPPGAAFRQVRVDGRPYRPERDGVIRLRKRVAQVEFRY
jgi:hypothetical protein